MCGIVGVVGKHEAAPVLVEALKRLEYRGYDSAGIATVNDAVLDRRRAVGKLVNLSDLLVHEPLLGKIGIGHTRWATHGAPSVTNSHPHRSGSVAVVHNGIIENYRALRAELADLGFKPETETDTEAVAQLTEHYIKNGDAPVAAAFRALDRLKGAFALAFVFDGYDDLIVAARQGSPLAIGYGDEEMYIGSDAIALAPMTDRICYLEEGDRVVVTRTGATIWNTAGAEVTRAVKTIEIDSAHVDKGGHKHFMAKEIAEQPSVIAEAIRCYLPAGSDTVALEGIDLDLSNVERLTMVACGTAYYACLTAKYWFEELAGLPVEVDVASEFRYREPPIPSKSLALFVSQSGETADTLAALRYCKGKVESILSVVNASESSIARESDIALPIHAGVEIGVASTKAFTCQLTVLLILALKAASDRGTMSAEQIADHVAALRGLPSALNVVLEESQAIREAAQRLSEARDVLFLGRGIMCPIALEGALKLKEISYIHAEGYAAGELKHGPLALIDNNMPVVVIAPMDGLFDKTMSNMREVMARDGKVVMLSDEAGLLAGGEDVWISIAMPKIHSSLAPILYALPTQLLAYYTAVAKGTDVDQPRNLAKSVTVE